MTPRPLSLFNSLGREQAPFQPIEPGHVRLYSCGPTVYNDAHIGNLRAYVFVDTLRRALAWKGYAVTHVTNITDVGHLTSDADEGDDKMERAAARTQRSVWEIAQHYTQAFHQDVERLNILPPSIWSKATDHIQEMIAFAAILERNGFTYKLYDGLYFDTSRVPNYGQLGLMSLEGQEAGKRVAGPQEKRSPSDFVIWRCSAPDQQRLMEWNSPWGMGVPGWHLECSVMSAKYLGTQFDIHTGGVDHRTIHHCNEIAQNQGYSQSTHPGANWWMHNEFLVVRSGDAGAKMSKSTGDFLTLQTLVDRGIHPLVYRLFLLGASYRSSVEFSWDALSGTRSYLRRLLLKVDLLKQKASPDTVRRVMSLAYDVRFQSGGPFTFLQQALVEQASSAAVTAYRDALDEAISNDLHTPDALVILGRILEDSSLSVNEALTMVALVDLFLGLNLVHMSMTELSIRPCTTNISEDHIAALVIQRQQARAAKDFSAADALRKQLVDSGVEIKDGPEGTAWEWAVPK